MPAIIAVMGLFAFLAVLMDEVSRSFRIYSVERRWKRGVVTFHDPGMNVGHWIYIIIGFVVLFTVIVALYPTLFSGASDFGNSTGAIGAVVVLLLPVLLAVAILLLFVRNFLPGGSKKGY